MPKILAMDPTVEDMWNSKIDADIAQAERFWIKYHALNMKDEATISDSQFESEQKGKKSNLKYKISMADIKRMELSIVDFGNLTDKNGKKVPYSKENITIIPPAVRTEFVTFLTGRDKVELNEEGELD